ncbi:MAG: alpha-2-macroglobulin family protein [Planctomycetota bacterium]
MKKSFLLLLLTSLLSSVPVWGQSAIQDAPAMPEELRQLLLDGDHAEALKQIRGFQQGEEDPEGFWDFLEARTLQRSGRSDQAREGFLAFEANFPESPWLPKVRYHHAELLARQGAWEEAERIWAEEVARLRGPERQRALADIYLDLAKELTAPLTGAAQRHPDDFQRARVLYQKAMDLDLPTDLQEQLLERIAWCSEQRKDWRTAVIDYGNYLERFDDAEVRYAYGEAQRKAEQLNEARRTYEDLADALADGDFEMEDVARDQLHGMALYSIAFTYDQGTEGRLAAISAFRRYLEAHAAHPKTSRARYGLAYHRYRLGQYEDALAEFEDFLQSVQPATDDQTEIENDARLRRSAQMRIAASYSELGRFEEAGAAYGKYVQLHPDGPEWSDAQTGMLQTEYWHALQLGEEHQWQQAREAHLAFLMNHPLDERVPFSLFELGDLYRQQAMTMQGEEDSGPREQLYRQAIQEWQGVIQRFPTTDQASRALYLTGVLQEMQLDELEKAVASYRACNFGYYQSLAQEQLMAMLEESLAIQTERTWRVDEPARFQLAVRNVEQVQVEIYRLDLEAYFRKHLTHEGIDRLDLDLIAADQEFERIIEDYEQYRPYELDIDLPVEGAGVWAVVVSSDTYRATTLVLRSDLDMIVRSSREEALIFVEDMERLEGAENVRLILAVPSQVSGQDAHLVELTTDADGIARIQFAQHGIVEPKEMHIFAADDRGVASTGQWLKHLNAAGSLEPAGFAYTDRSAYLPGSLVSWRALMRDVHAEAFTYKPGEIYRVSMTDSRGRVVVKEEQALSAFGSLHGAWRLAEGAPQGEYLLRCISPRGKTTTARFQVEEFELQKLQVVLEADQDLYFRNEMVALQGTASWYWGAPYANGKIRLTTPDGRHHELITDADGAFELDFDTHEMRPGRSMRFVATAMEEGVSGDLALYLAKTGFRIGMHAAKDLQQVGKPTSVLLTTTAASGDPVAKTLTVRLKHETKLADGSTEFITVETLEVTTDEEGQAVVVFNPSEGGDYSVSAEGVDRFGNLVDAYARFFLSGEDDEDKLRLLTDAKRLNVDGSMPFTLLNRAEESLALLTFEGSGILDYRVVRLQEGENSFDEAVPQNFFPEVTVSVAMMSGNAFHEAEHRYRVRRNLTVKVTPRTEQVRPGEEILVDLEVTDQNGAPVTAELSFAMVDEALFDLYPDRSGVIGQPFELRLRRPSPMISTSSNAFSYAGVTRSIDDALLEEGRRQLAAQTWDANRDKAKERLGKLGQRVAPGEYQGPGDSVPPGGGVAPSTPGAPVLSVDFDSDDLSSLGYAMDEMALEDAEEWNSEVGLGGGAGGKMGGRGGKSLAARKRASRPADWAEEQVGQNDTEHLDRMTAYWNPSVVTDRDGKAVVRFTAPQQSTSWRLMARGSDAGTTVGQGVSSIITRADFFVEARWPSVLLEGDRGSVMVRVHNLTGLTGEADLKLTLDYAGQLQQVVHKLGYSDATMQEVLLTLPETVPAGFAGQAKLQIIAEGGFAEPDGLSRISELTASLTRNVAVAPWGLPVAAAKSGILSDQEVLELHLPKGGNYSAVRWQLELGMGMDQMLVSEALGGVHSQWLGFNHEVRMPDRQSGTASELLGALAVLKHLQVSGQADTEPHVALRRRADGLLANLLNRQHQDGGWAWSGADRQSHVDVSAMAMIALEHADRAGLTVDGGPLGRGRQYLTKALTQADKRQTERRARLVYALSLSEKADFAFANSLHRQRLDLSPVACAFTALALMEMKSAPMAGEVAQAMLKRRSVGAGHYGLHCAPVEGTALALWATLEAWPGALAEIAEMEEELMAQRPWYGEDAHGLALTALARHRGNHAQRDRDITVLMQVGNGQEREIPMKGPMAVAVLEEALPSNQEELRVRLRVRGKGQPHYALVLEGFDTDPKESNNREMSVALTEFHAPPPMYDGREMPVGFNQVRNHRKEWRNTVEQLAYGDIAPMRVDFYRQYKREDVEHELDFLMIEIPLPAGTRLLEDSLTGNVRGWRLDRGVLKVDVGQHRGSGRIHFRLHGLQPGTYRTLPVVLRSVYRPDRFAVGKSGVLSVLERGQATEDAYRATPDELYATGMAAYAANDAEVAWQKLNQLFDEFDAFLNAEPQKLAARAMLSLAVDRRDSNRIVQFFETLKEKDPNLSVPFARLTHIAEAYRQLGESERAARIYRAVAQETFGKDLQLVAVLEQQQDFHAASEALHRFWQEYPDFPAVVETGVTLADRLLLAAPDAYRDASLRDAKRTRVVLLYESVIYLQRFLSMYPEEAVAADAALNLINAYLDLEDYPNAARLADEFSGRFTEPRFLDAFLYTQAVAQWYQGEDAKAVALLTRIAEAKYPIEGGGVRASDNRDLALYILAQIHHAKQDFTDAARYYEQVSTVFADAREVLADFRRKALGLDEVTEVAPDEKAKLTLHYRNLTETELLVYPVDLMTLYLREKNLAGITQVNLAGIEPVIRSTVELPDDGSMRGQEHEIELELPGPGAYLLICRSDAIHASGMILVSDFELVVETDPQNGGVRAQAVSRTDGKYLRDVDIRVIGRHDHGFQSGHTDPRGLYVTSGIRGAATVIARHDGRHYAFYRGLGAAPQPTFEGGFRIESTERLNSESYFDNVRSLNRSQQQQRDSKLKNKQDQTYMGLELNSLQ